MDWEWWKILVVGKNKNYFQSDKPMLRNFGNKDKILQEIIFT